MLEYQEPEPMEFEYTSPSSTGCRSSFHSNNEQRYTPLPLGSFPVPESFFENKYNKSTAIANKIADAFTFFSINDPSESEQEPAGLEEVPTVNEAQAVEKENDAMALALYSPPLSPQQPIENPIFSADTNHFGRRTSTASTSTSTFHDSTTKTSPSYTKDFPSVEQKEDNNNSYTLPSPKYSSKAIFNHAPNYNPSFIHSPHYTPSYTYYYEKPTPADPLAQSHGTLYFIQGLFRLILSSIIFGAGGYIIYRFGVNFSHDMVEKMNFYESDAINTQRECRNAYDKNRCSADYLVPAVVEMCREWEHCMFQPIVVRRSKAFAETFADMANGFFEKLTTKTLFMSVILGIALIWAFTNIVMGHPNAPAQAPSSKPSESAEDRETQKRVKSKIETLKFEPQSAIL